MRPRPQLPTRSHSPLCVANPCLKYIWDEKNQVMHSYFDLIPHQESELHRFRFTGRSDQNPYRCFYCMAPIYLVSHIDGKQAYFKHENDPTSICPYRAESGPSQREIDARRFNGKKESWRHQELKAWIVASLRCDPDCDPASIKVERQIRNLETGARRQPDVQAVYRGMPVIFEIQLCTTFLNVVVDRTQFYQQHGAYLIWIFDKFSPSQLRMMHKDIFYNNNHNAFVIDQETVTSSLVSKRLILSTYWEEAQNALKPIRCAPIPLSEMTFDEKLWRVYHYDHLGIAGTVTPAPVIETPRPAEPPTVGKKHSPEDPPATKWPLPITQDTFRMWCTGFLNARKETQPEPAEKYKALWQIYQKVFERALVTAPEDPYELPESALKILYSFKDGRPWIYGFKKLAEVANMVCSSQPQHLHLMRLAMLAYGRHDQLTQESAAFREKVKTYKTRLKENPDAFPPDTKGLPLLAYLFPEVFKNETLAHFPALHQACREKCRISN